jgi:glutaredoxin
VAKLTDTSFGNAPSRRSLLALTLALFVVWAGGNAFRSWSENRTGDSVAALAKPGDILMLSSVTCVYCKLAREWFTAHKVAFDECFIENDAACEQRYRANLAPGTPVLLVKGQRQVGFSPSDVQKALGG